MLQLQAELIDNKRVQGDYFRCVLSAEKIAQLAQPGQFVNIKVSNHGGPLLRRPFSIHRVQGKKIELLCEIVGRGSELLAQRKKGEYLDVIGPLGHGFVYSRAGYASLSPILVAGGIGVAPLLFLAEKLNKKKGLVLIGARNKTGLLCLKDFNDLGWDVQTATEDGSGGFCGRVTKLLAKILRIKKNDTKIVLYACGPWPMLKQIADLSQGLIIPAQVALEEHMACGIGACLGCVIGTKSGYQRVCQEGPVFKADEIIWHKGGQ